jgi:FKBP-type peptidyl-prolyl cis-trans isomerase 2
MLQTGDTVKIAYSGKIKESGQEFDHTDGVAIVIGGNYVLPALEEELKTLDIGQKKTVELAPEKAFGSRKPELVRTVPESEFRRHNTKPTPGQIIEADGARGRIVSVNSGRVMVDFNHPLAGRVLVYDIELKSKIEKPEDCIKAVAEYYSRVHSDKIKVIISGCEAEIQLPPSVHPIWKKKISDDVFKFWKEIHRVKFAEIFEKAAEAKPESPA